METDLAIQTKEHAFAKQVACFDNPGFVPVHAHDSKVPVLVYRVIAERDLSGYNWIDLVVVPPGGDIGVHTHEVQSEEVYIVVSGQGTMTLDGEEIRVGPGHVVRNQPGGSHSLVNDGSSALHLVVLDVTNRYLQPSTKSSSTKSCESRAERTQSIFVKGDL